MGGGPVRYSARTMFTGSTGGRQMPGESRSPLHGARNKASLLRAASAGTANTVNTNMFTEAWQDSVGRRLGSFPLFSSSPRPSGVGGGPNERGTSAGSFKSLGWNIFGNNDLSFTISNGARVTVDTNFTYRSQTGAIVNKDARHIQYNYPYYFAEDLSSEFSWYISWPYSAGGGGWGASGGDYFIAGTGTSYTLSAGGAGGPAVKTNGNAVTWTGGQGTDRVFGAIS